MLPYDASQPEQTTRKTLKVNGRPGLLPSRPLSTTPTPGRNPLIKFLSTLLWPSARLPAISALQGTEACIWEDSLVLQPGLALQRDGECPPPLDRVQCTYAASSWKPMNGRCAPVHVPTARIDPAKLDTRRSRKEESTEGGVRGSPHVWAFTINDPGCCVQNLPASSRGESVPTAKSRSGMRKETSGEAVSGKP